MFLLFLIETTRWLTKMISSYYIKITEFLHWLEIIEIEFVRKNIQAKKKIQASCSVDAGSITEYKYNPMA